MVASVAADRVETDRRERRRQAMLDAARELFVERGYDSVSLSEIVKRSGGSLATLYELFDNKSGLLGAIVASKRFCAHEEIDATVARGGVPAEMIADIAAIIIDSLSDDETIGLMRVVMGETLRDPAFAESIFTAAYLPSVERLARLFSEWNKAGLAVIPHPMLAVHAFFALVIHGQQSRAFYGAVCEATLPPRDIMLKEAVALFVTYYRISADGPA